MKKILLSGLFLFLFFAGYAHTIDAKLSNTTDSTPTDCPKLISFTGGAVNDTTISFKWQLTTGRKSKLLLEVIEIGNRNYNSAFFYSTDTSSASFTIPKGICNSYRATLLRNCDSSTYWYDELSTINFSTKGCTAADCQKPNQIFSFRNILYWNGSPAAEKNYIDYRIISTDTTKPCLRDSTPLDSIVLKLNNCEIYEVKITSVCAGGYTVISETFKMTPACFIPGDCNKVTSFTSQLTNDTTVLFKWALVPGSNPNIHLNVSFFDGTFNFLRNFDTTATSMSVTVPRCKKYVANLYTDFCETAPYFNLTPPLYFNSGGCTASDCYTPYNLEAYGNYGDTTTLIEWYAYDSHEKYYIDYRLISDSTTNAWKRDSSNNGSIYLRLNPCSNYAVKITNVCSGGFTNSSEIVNIKSSCTTFNCAKALSFTGGNTSDSTASFNWKLSANSNPNVILKIGSGDGTFVKEYPTSQSSLNINVPHCNSFTASLTSDCSSQSVLASLNFQTQACTAKDCVKPGLVLAFSNYQNDTMNIEWNAGFNKKYYIDYRLISDSTTNAWKRDSSLSKNIRLKLNYCSTYEAKITAICQDGTQTTGDVQSFDTPCPTVNCPIIQSFTDSIINDTTILFKWTVTNGANPNVIIKLLTQDYSQNNEIYTNKSSIIVKVQHCTKYYSYITTRDGSCIAPSVNFETKGCTQVDCIVPTNFGGFQDYPYADSMTFYWTGNANKYFVEYRMKSDSISNVWLNDSTNYNRILLRNLQPCTEYAARVTSICASGIKVTSDITYFKTYCGDGGPIGTKCPKVSDFKVVEANGTANFSWKTSVGVDSFYLIINALDTFYSKLFVVNNSNFIISGLPLCKNFHAILVSFCSGVFTYNSSADSIAFSTTGCKAVPCPTVQNIAVKNIADSATVSWDTNSNIVSYQIQYQIAGDTAWSKLINTKAPNYLIKNLKPCVTYIVRVRTVCDTSGILFSNWTEARFKPGTNCLRGGNSGVVSNARATISVSPNPGSGNPTVVYKLESTSTVKIDVINLYGSILETFNAGELSEGAYNYQFTQIENLPTGLYFIRLHTNGEINQTIKWVKN